MKKMVEAKGGDTYGQLLAAAITIPAADVAGMFTLEATLTNLKIKNCHRCNAPARLKSLMLRARRLFKTSPCLSPVRKWTRP